MLRYTIKRILLGFMTLFIILSIVFVLVKMLPTVIPIEYLIQEGFDPVAWAHKYGWDQPVIGQYLLWILNVIREWDWGISCICEPGVEAFAYERELGRTMRINIFAFIISMPLGFLFGIIAALNKNKWPDYIISFFVIFFISIPNFVIVTLLMYFPAYKWGWFPIQFPPSNVAAIEMARGMVIPVMALSFGPIATLTRYTRAELTEVLTSEFLLLARTKGLNRRQCVMRHALRNSMVPLIGIVIGNLIGIIGGSIVIEQIYGVVGVGQVFLRAISQLDYPASWCRSRFTRAFA